MREEEKKGPSQSFFKKRWVFPAMYLVSAALLISAILWYQAANNDVADPKKGSKDEQAADNQFDNPSVEVNSALENFAMPVVNPDEAVIEKQFYDTNATEEEQEAALVVYNNTYHPNRGIDITMKDNKEFDVVAAMSGTVTNVKEDSLLGNVIEIEHQSGVVTQYQSVKDFKVQVGDQVKQGDVIAKAGQSLYNEEAGTHVHFEIRQDNVPVNPVDFFGKSLSALADKAKADAKAKEADKAKEDQSAGEKSSDDQSSSDQSGTDSSQDNADQSNDGAAADDSNS